MIILKLLHLSDLHLGKLVHEFSMIEEQEYILKQLLNIVEKEQPKAVLISGDVYDRTIASAEALRLFDDFLVGLVNLKAEVFVISGNHDSADRLAFGSRLMNKSGVHVSRVYNGTLESFSVSDEFGDVIIHLMPFLKPAHVRRFYPDEEISTWTDAVSTVIKNTDIDKSKRNILLAHQFVTGAKTCDSEEINIGGADNIDAEIFNDFDYVALGHLHGAQSIERKTVRYCGSPIKYSFSECRHKKSATIVEFTEKENISIKEIPLVPKRDLQEIKGKYLEITSRENYKNINLDNYFHITLTDEEDQPNALGKLRTIYPNLMLLDYDNKRTRTGSAVSSLSDISSYSPVQLFDMLYKEQNGQPMTEAQRDFLIGLAERVWEESL